MSGTEARNPNTTNIDKVSTLEMLEMIQNENIYAVQAVGAVLSDIAKAVDAVTEGMKNGGRLIYIGAGTSGRLGVIDAAECPPTFGVERGLVVGLIAGGKECMFRAAEGEEDSGESGIFDLNVLDIVPADCIVGISAAGNAAYVAEALSYARSVGCTTVGITSNKGSRLANESDIPIVVETGAEAITGSTRMKAGTAQKLILNMLSTCAMVKTGKVYENLMINLRPSNAKLRRRVISIVRELCSCDEEAAIKILDENKWVIRDAVDKYKSEAEKRSD